MADYPISNVARRIVYTGSAGVGPYAFNFEVLANTDLNVYKNDVLLTLTTNYTVTISPTLGTGSITLVVAATGADRITIVGARAIQRTTDFTTGGDFFANTLNDEMDSQTILVQQVAETAERGIKAPVTDPTSINMVLPINTARAGKTLAFDANGNPIAGDAIGNWRGDWVAGISYQNRDLIKDTTNGNVYIVLTAHTSSGSLPISTNADSAKWGLVVDAAAAGASATAAAASASAASSSASAASTSASNASISASNASTSASTATTQASNASASATSAAASYDSFDDRYLGAKTSDPTLDNDSNALLTGALYFDSVSSAMKVYTGAAWVAAYVSGTGFLVSSNNLSDVANTTTARANISAAKSGANSDLTSLTGLTTPLSVAQGGFGAGTHTLNSLLLGNGTSELLEVAPSTSGNVLTSNGTTWTSEASVGYAGFTTEIFASSTTFTLPTGITQARITVIGGGGGARSGVGAAAGGDGGSAIAYCTQISGSLTITVGTGGNGNTSTNGTSGTASSITGTGVSISATGGGAASSSVAGTDGTGTVTTGTALFAGLLTTSRNYITSGGSASGSTSLLAVVWSPTNNSSAGFGGSTSFPGACGGIVMIEY